MTNSTLTRPESHSFTFAEPYDKKGFTLLLKRLLNISRHFGWHTRDLFAFICKTTHMPDMNNLIIEAERISRKRGLNSIQFIYSAKQHKWACSIYYGWNDRVEGIGSCPDIALSEALINFHNQLRLEEMVNE